MKKTKMLLVLASSALMLASCGGSGNSSSSSASASQTPSSSQPSSGSREDTSSTPISGETSTPSTPTSESSSTSQGEVGGKTLFAPIKESRVTTFSDSELLALANRVATICNRFAPPDAQMPEFTAETLEQMKTAYGIDTYLSICHLTLAEVTALIDLADSITAKYVDLMAETQGQADPSAGIMTLLSDDEIGTELFAFLELLDLDHLFSTILDAQTVLGLSASTFMSGFMGGQAAKNPMSAPAEAFKIMNEALSDAYAFDVVRTASESSAEVDIEKTIVPLLRFVKDFLLANKEKGISALANELMSLTTIFSHSETGAPTTAPTLETIASLHLVLETVVSLGYDEATYEALVNMMFDNLQKGMNSKGAYAYAVDHNVEEATEKMISDAKKVLSGKGFKALVALLNEASAVLAEDSSVDLNSPDVDKLVAKLEEAYGKLILEEKNALNGMLSLFEISIEDTIAQIKAVEGEGEAKQQAQLQILMGLMAKVTSPYQVETIYEGISAQSSLLFYVGDVINPSEDLAVELCFAGVEGEDLWIFPDTVILLSGDVSETGMTNFETRQSYTIGGQTYTFDFGLYNVPVYPEIAKHVQMPNDVEIENMETMYRAYTTFGMTMLVNVVTFFDDPSQETNLDDANIVLYYFDEGYTRKEAKFPIKEIVQDLSVGVSAYEIFEVKNGAGDTVCVFPYEFNILESTDLGGK